MSIKDILTRSDTLLRELGAQQETERSRQCELLKAIKDEPASEKTPLHLISASFFQWLLLATGFIYGLFAIRETSLQKEGYLQSVMQNQLALVQFCQNYNSRSSDHYVTI